MKAYRPAQSSRTSLVVVLLVYLLIGFLVLFFSNKLLADATIETPLVNPLLIVLALTVPVFLLGSIVWNIIQLVREKRKGNPGVRFKLKLMIFFMIVVFFSCLPQGLLSVNFIGNVLSSGFIGQFGEALHDGLGIALDTHDSRYSSLSRLTDSPVFREIIAGVEDDPGHVWSVLSLDPAIGSMQVFGPDGSERYFVGDERSRLAATAPSDVPDGNIETFTAQGLSLLRGTYLSAGRTGLFRVILSVLLPEGFSESSVRLTQAVAAYDQIVQYKAVFRTAVFVLYCFFALPLVLLSILVSFLLSEEIIRPLANLEEATRRVTDGDFSFRILTREDDELSQLAASFNRMVAELESSRHSLLQTEKIAAWQEIAQRLAHEIKNPLTPIKLAAERILRRTEGKNEELERIVRPGVEAIVREVDNLNRLLSEFREFTDFPGPEKTEVSLRDLVAESCALYASHATIRFDLGGLDPELRLLLDPNQIKQVFANLFKNAIEAMPTGGTIDIRANLVKKGNSQYCRIQVQDTGTGIGEDVRDKVFNPYFTTKKEGTGLGLPIIERFVFDHSGQIWFESEKGSGTTFFIDLPV